MSMRGFIGLSLTAMLAGCGVAGQVDDGSQDQTAEGAFKVRCPDPNTDCTSSNGAGVYTEELGFAGIGSRQFMIMYFVNVAGGGINVVGRYYDANSSTWQVQTVPVYYANYAGKKTLTVLSVSENLTVPTWTLYDSSTGTNIAVTGADLLNLEVVVAIDKLYTLTWDSYTGESDRAAIRKYNMEWRLTGAPTGNQYCLRADWSKDDVVFQQGMIVNPVTAMVTRNSTTDNVVTLSCRYGAMAQVRLWGYPYRAPSNTWFFDAGLHMKRASYCGDEAFYTKSGTKIHIWDSAGAQTYAMAPSEIEAWWTPNGATCIGPMRHAAMGFSGSCNGVPLPPCSTAPAGKLADGASPPGP